MVLTAITPTSPGVAVRRLGALSPPLKATAGYVSRRGDPRTPEDLADHECLRFFDHQPQTAWPLVNIESGHVVMAPVGGRFACNDSRTMLLMLREGFGLGPMFRGAPEPGNLESPLVTVLPEWRFAPMDLYIVIAPGRRRLGQVRAVVDDPRGHHRRLGRERVSRREPPRTSPHIVGSTNAFPGVAPIASTVAPRSRVTSCRTTSGATRTMSPCPRAPALRSQL